MHISHRTGAMVPLPLGEGLDQVEIRSTGRVNMDYEALDISALCNGGLDLLEDGGRHRAWAGHDARAAVPGRSAGGTGG